MNWFRSLVFVPAVLAACGPTYVPPEEIKTISTRNSAKIIGFEETVVRTAFRADSAMSEIAGADCTLTYNGAKSRFPTPHKIRIPIQVGAQQNIGLECTATIGPAVRKSVRVLPPAVPTVSDQKTSDRVYPETIGLIFK
ncbi:hypothetical protein ACXYMO_00150 [Arenibacterium sp. CAU 1754]